MEKIKEIEPGTGLLSALAAFQDKIGKIRKDAKNPFFKSNYASITKILDDIKQVLKECGLVFAQMPHKTYGLKTIIWHVKSGQSITSTMFVPAAKEDPQGAGSAITYMRRYALVSMLCLNVDDDDGNAASVPVSLDKGTLEQIATCKDLDELEGIWAAYKGLQSNNEFKTAIQRRKSEIK